MPASPASAPIAPATSPPRQGLLLVNLGTPQAPSAAAVRRYLSEFLHDHRVVQLTRWLWCPLLHGLILPLRGPRVAEKYASIWMDEGSPLAVHTQRLAAALQARLPALRVAHAMRYGQPALADAVHSLQAQGCTQVLVLPLYPQYSTTTTASVSDGLEKVAKEADAPSLRMIEHYATDPGVIAALAGSVRGHWQRHGRGELLLFSFHGIPQRLVDGGDPYADQCRATVAALAQALELTQSEYRLCFQSRFGREQWLRPATDATLHELAASGVRRVDVLCPGFAVDCLETLEEIAMLNARLFKHEVERNQPSALSPQPSTLRPQPSALSPQPSLHYIPCLNDAPAHADALAALARREFDAWAQTR